MVALANRTPELRSRTVITSRSALEHKAAATVSDTFSRRAISSLCRGLPDWAMSIMSKSDRASE